MTTSPTLDTLKQKRRELNLGDPVIEQIIQEKEQQFEQHREEYRIELYRDLRHSGNIDDTKLQKIQHQLKLGDSVVQKILQQETERFKQHKSEYASILKFQLHQSGIVDSEELKTLQVKRELGDAVVKEVTHFVEQEFQVNVSRYQQAALTNLHHYDRLNEASLSHLQAELELGDAVAKNLQEDATKRFEDHKLLLEQEYAKILQDESPPFTTATEQALKTLETKLGFNETVARAILKQYLQRSAKCDIYRDKWRELLRHYDVLSGADFSLEANDEAALQPYRKDLTAQEIQTIETEESATYRQELQTYASEFYKILQSIYPEAIPESVRTTLNHLQETYVISPDIANAIESRITQEYQQEYQQEWRQQNLDSYRHAVTEAIARQTPISESDRQQLNELRQSLKLTSDETELIEAEVITHPPRKKLRTTLAIWALLSAIALVIAAIAYRDLARLPEPAKSGLTNPLLTPTTSPTVNPTTSPTPTPLNLSQVHALSLESKLTTFWQRWLEDITTLATSVSPDAPVTQAQIMKDAILKAHLIPKEAEEVFPDAQALINQTSQEMLKLAQDHYNQVDLEVAIAILKEIPDIAPTSANAKELITTWQQHLEILKAVETALTEGNRSEASSKLQELKGTSLYDTERVQELLQQATPPPAPAPRTTTSSSSSSTRTSSQTQPRTSSRTQPRSSSHRSSGSRSAPSNGYTPPPL